MKKLLIIIILLTCPVAYSQTWQSIPLKTQAQSSAGLSGGEGFQMPFDIDYAPTNTNTVYMVVDTSQVWKSTDGGVTWGNKSVGFRATGGSSIAVSPFNENVVFVSGSPMESTEPDSSQQGIYRTLDGGETWTQVKSHYTKRNNNYPGGDLICFTGSNTIYAGTADEGLLRSTDGGATWGQLATPTQLGASNLQVIDVKVTGTSTDGVYPKTIFVVTNNSTYKIRKVVNEDSGSTTTITTLGTGLLSYPNAIAIAGTDTTTMYAACRTDGVYKSTNSGANFSAINSGGVSTAIAAAKKAEYVEVSPVDSRYVFVGFNKESFFCSWNAGTTWNTPISTDQNLGIENGGWVAGSLLENNAQSRFDYHRNPIALHPTDKNILITSGQDHGLKKSVDGGQNFLYTGTGFTGGRMGTAINNGSGLSTISWNTANRFAFFMGDTGAFMTEDGGNIFRNIRPNRNVELSTISGAIDPTSNSGIVITAVGNWSTQQIQITRNAFPGTTTDPTWVTPISTATAKFSYIVWGTTTGNNVVYADRFRFNDIQSTNNNYTYLTHPVEAVFPGNRDIVYSIESGGSGITRIYKSTNQGSSWTTPYPDLSEDYSNVKQVIVDTNDENKLYAAVQYKGIYILDGSWSQVGTATLVKADWQTTIYTQAVAIDPNDTDILYAAARPPSTYGHANGLFRSTNGGTIWTNITGNLGPEITVWGVTVNPYDSYVFVATDRGTWKYPPPGAGGTGTPGSAPTVNTGTATAVTVTTATLHAEINPNGSSTTCRWQYGTQSGNYTTNTGSQTVGAGTASVSMQQAVTGLLGSTTYYVRAQANSANGSANGSETTFATLQRFSLSVSMGTPTVNGSLSDWTTPFTNALSKTISGSGAEGLGTWSAMWNNTGLHVAFHGSDTALYADSGNTNVYNDDGFEIYIDRDNNKGTSYDGYDYHLGWNYHGTFTRAYNGTNTGVVVGTSSASGGYIMEVTIPWTAFTGGVVPSGTTTIGFDIQCNGDTNGGAREIAKDWNASGDTNHFNPSTFGELILVSSGSTAGTETVAVAIGTISGNILWLKMDESAGSSTADSSGYGNGGTLHGGVRWGTHSIRYGSCTVFNGSTGTLTVGSPSLLDNVVPISVTAMIRPITAGEGTDGRVCSLIDPSGSTTGKLLIGLNSNNAFYFTKHYQTTDISKDTATNTVVMDKWQSVVATFNGSATATDTHLYVDGVESGINLTNGVGSMTSRSINNWIIGNNGSDTKTFNGYIDDFRIYNKILSAQEVMDIVTVGSVTVTVGSATLITQTSATYNGTVTPNGSSTFNAYFQTGTQTGIYTGTSTEQLIGTGSTPVALSRLSGTLTTNTTYFIVPVAYNSAGIHVKGSETSFATIGADATSPTGTITINSNGTYTTTVGVTLNLSATDDVGVEGYYVSGSTTTPTAGQAGWVAVGTNTAYSESIPYTLSANDGTKTVYVWYKDGVGSVSTTTSDSIIFDSTFPSILITSPVTNYYIYSTGVNAYGTTGSAYTITGSSTDTNGIVSVVYANSATSTTGAMTGTDSFSLALSIVSGQVNTFSITGQDNAGNQNTATVSIGAFPSVTTDFATSITQYATTLNGTCSANNNTTTTWFDYGINPTNYTGSSTTGTVTGSANTTVNIILNNLNQNTTYYYRLAGSNTVGIVYGDELDFVTTVGAITNGEYQYRSQFNSTRFRENILKANNIDLKFRKKIKNDQEWENLKNDPDGFLSNLMNEPIK